ncbi:MAG: hypothetical protein ACO3QC_11710 [Phycisphaerales bacterium]
MKTLDQFDHASVALRESRLAREAMRGCPQAVLGFVFHHGSYRMTIRIGQHQQTLADENLGRLFWRAARLFDECAPTTTSEAA